MKRFVCACCQRRFISDPDYTPAQSKKESVEDGMLYSDMEKQVSVCGSCYEALLEKLKDIGS